jgi:hypothetical protein
MNRKMMRDMFSPIQRRLMVGALSTLGVFMTSAPLLLVGCADYDDGDTTDEIENRPSEGETIEAAQIVDCKEAEVIDQDFVRTTSTRTETITYTCPTGTIMGIKAKKTQAKSCDGDNVVCRRGGTCKFTIAEGCGVEPKWKVTFGCWVCPGVDPV